MKLIAVGTGEALALGRRGDADVLIVHSPDDEVAFMRAGHGARRLPVMYNDFVVVGPAHDPAGLRATRSATEAFQRIAAVGAPFVSRGDESGTHRRELSLWDAAGIPVARTARHRIEVGQGMGETLAIASERGAHALSDRGTFIVLGEVLQLDILVEDWPDLHNPYSVITVAGAANAEAAEAFADWLVQPRTRARIRDFGADRHGRSLFLPANDTTPQ